MPTSPEQLIEQATRHAAHLERLKSHEVKMLREILGDIEGDIMARLARQDISAWSRKRMTKQLSVIGRMINERFGKDMIPALRASIRDLAEYEAGFEIRSLRNVVKYDFDLPAPAQIMSAVTTAPLSVRTLQEGMLLEEFLEEWTPRQIRRVEHHIRAGFAAGRTTPQVLSAMRAEMLPSSQREMETIARTGLQHAAATAREATWRANSDIIKRVRWVSTLDSRTSPQCMSLDGTLFPIDQGPRPPIHPNCRSTTVAALDERFDFLDEGATRVSRDPTTGKVGSVDAKQTYYDWLKKQPTNVQNSIIGPTRGKLMRDGGISSERFAELQLGKRFEPLTLAEMRELEPVAFERAGV